MILKQARIKSGILQEQVANQLKCSVPAYSNIENGIALPTLQQCVILDRLFGTHIEFADVLSPVQRHNVITAIQELSDKYPLQIILDFCAKSLRREFDGADKICEFAKASSEPGFQPLAKPIKTNK